MKKRQVFFILSLIIAIAATAVSFATTSGTTSISVSASSSSSDVLEADDDGEHKVAPSWSPTANSVGSIDPGDLYIIDLENNGDTAEDRRLTLYLNNPDELSKAYSYLNMNIVVYESIDDGVSWALSTITPNPNDAYLTLTNGYVSFDLDGGKKYSISVDGGSYYCMTTDVAGNLAPSFFAELR